MDCSQRYLILGIGNSLLSDDGVGVHAARLLEAEPPPGTTILVVETDWLAALPYLERCTHALVIDAMEAGRPPGTLYYCGGETLVGSGRRYSLHEMGLRNILEFIDEPRRPRLHVLGVQPGRIGFSLELSPEVALALPGIVDAAHRIVGEFRSSPKCL